jgi:hypothetical protein
VAESWRRRRVRGSEGKGELKGNYDRKSSYGVWGRTRHQVAHDSNSDEIENEREEDPEIAGSQSKVDTATIKRVKVPNSS